MDEWKSLVKPGGVPKLLAMGAWEKARVNKGAPGVDAVAIEMGGNFLWSPVSAIC